LEHADAHAIDCEFDFDCGREFCEEIANDCAALKPVDHPSTP
jgi:hypothetical protein